MSAKEWIDFASMPFDSTPFHRGCAAEGRGGSYYREGFAKPVKPCCAMQFLHMPERLIVSSKDLVVLPTEALGTVRCDLYWERAG